MSARREATEQRVTPLELFFDLVFVFAITRVTALMADDLSWSLNRRRLAAGALCAACIPLGTELNAVAALALVTALTCSLIAYETMQA